MTAPADTGLSSPEAIADPYPYYAWLREHAPVHHDTAADVWIVSRHEDVMAVVRDHARFSSHQGLPVDNDPFNPNPAPPWAAVVLRRVQAVRVLLTTDPPDHTMLRRRVAKAFTPRRIAAWEPRIRQVADELVERMAGREGPADLVRDLASPLPTTIIAELMGIPAERSQDFKRWSDQLIDGLFTGGSRAGMMRGLAAISWFFLRTVRQRRRRGGPSDDLVGLLTAEGDEPLTAPELVTFCVLLLVAGNETTTNLVSNSMAALFDRPDQWARIVADPSLAEAAVEEALRFDGPAQGLLRIATADTLLAGVTIPAGARVLPLLGSANRDPAHWESPDEFLLDRPSGRDHLAFGTGIHYCIGHLLARIEARAALEALARRLPDLAPAGPPTRMTSPVLRGLRAQPVHPFPP